MLIALTPGEPAGIGPDLAIMLAQRPLPTAVLALADAELLRERAAILRLPLELLPLPAKQPAPPAPAGKLYVLLEGPRLAASAVPGRLDPRNSAYVLDCLRRAVALCRDGISAAMVTGPAHKGVINDAGIAFSGHTEFLAELCAVPPPVMLLAAGALRVALATTHLPLKDVPGAITTDGLYRTIEVLHAALIEDFGIARPRILVCGLNPHAGEGGHLGHEELAVIKPVIESLSALGMQLQGPLPADTAFTPAWLERADAVLAMYHDQGLPVLKNRGFGQAVNITLGLPIVRTSVDHGTALDLAGSGKADDGSLRAALETALAIAQRRAG
ncbi:MAG: 4-hydroxythreonine-4-phosphate dehydrogenase PdxA [Nevskiales bacterium]